MYFVSKYMQNKIASRPMRQAASGILGTHVVLTTLLTTIVLVLVCLTIRSKN